MKRSRPRTREKTFAFQQARRRGTATQEQDLHCSTPRETLVAARKEHDPQMDALIAVAEGSMQTAPSTYVRSIHILPRNQAALHAISRPRHQSGQENTRQVQGTNWTQRRHNNIHLAWDIQRLNSSPARRQESSKGIKGQSALCSAGTSGRISASLPF